MTYDFSLTKRAAALFFSGWAMVGVLLFFVGWVAGAHWAISEPARAGAKPGAALSGELASAGETDPSTPKAPVVDDTLDALYTAPGANHQVPPLSPSAAAELPQKMVPSRQSGTSVTASPSETVSPANPGPIDDEPKIIQEAKPAAAQAPTEPTPPPPGRYLAFTVQVGAFLDPSESSRLIAELEIKGYSVNIFVAHDAQDRQWYTVRLGAYADQTEATRAAANFMKQEKMKAVVKRLGSL